MQTPPVVRPPPHGKGKVTEKKASPKPNILQVKMINDPPAKPAPASKPMGPSDTPSVADLKAPPMWPPSHGQSVGSGSLEEIESDMPTTDGPIVAVNPVQSLDGTDASQLEVNTDSNDANNVGHGTPANPQFEMRRYRVIALNFEWEEQIDLHWERFNKGPLSDEIFVPFGAYSQERQTRPTR